MPFDFAVGLGLVVTAALAAIGGLLLMAAMPGRPQAGTVSLFRTKGEGTVFLFDGESLVDSSPGAKALLASSAVRGGPWLRLTAYLSHYFPDIDTHLSHLATDGLVTISTADPTTQTLLVQMELRGGLTRITLSDPETDNNTGAVDPIAHRAQTKELSDLRAAIAQAPLLIWRERSDDEVIWANSAYLMRVTTQLPPGVDLSWPLPRLFERKASTQGALGQRQRISLVGGGAAWFDLVSFADGDERLLFATPADTAVNAESALRDFMQTLSKTFAHLPIGLAIFDRQRQLQLFNPALLDLTGLPVDFLSLRPSLLSVLDAMRDRNMIPEPKDYRGWRRELMELEKAAASGLYEETWSLPAGQTYRVIGRPHPNGALALMIEDISTEMSRTRRYRAELDLGQSVIDAMDAALAVFSPAGLLVMSNAAYARLWGHDPGATLGDVGIRSLAAHWRDLSAPNPVWSDAEEYVATLGERPAWTGEARLTDGRMITCNFAPLSGGSTLASFRVIAASETTQPRLAEGSALRSA